jgi:steroid delta-isomerase-like uncharacterized protein
MASPDWKFYLNQLEPLSAETFPDVVTMFRTAFPDLNNTIEEQVVEEDVVVTRGTTRGTHRAALGEVPPTGKSIAVPWVVFTRFKDGRIVEDRELYDEHWLMKQLGVIS